jgi:hypothetical protein
MAMRGIIAVFLLVLAFLQLQQGNVLNAAVDTIFAIVAGLLAFGARPGGRRAPNTLVAGLVIVGIVLWIAALVGRGT